MRNTLPAAALGTVALALAAGTAHGTAPGHNGQIAYSEPLPSRHTTRAIFVVGADGTGARRLTRPADGVLDDHPDWSPDGSTLAFERCGRRCAVYAIEADGTGLRRLGPACDRRPPACEDRSTPAWSPDGTTIAFARSWGAVRTGRRWGRYGQIAHAELSLMDAAGGHVRRITTLTARRPYTGDVGRPTWSPDGTRIAFGVWNSAAGTPARGRALFIARADGSGLRRLTPWKLRAGDHPDFSPDGRRILVGAGVRGAHDRGGELWAVDPDSGAVSQITHSGRRGIVSSGSWAPDGGSLAFAQLRAGEAFLMSLFTMAPDGTQVREITKPGAVEHPDWGPSPTPR